MMKMNKITSLIRIHKTTYPQRVCSLSIHSQCILNPRSINYNRLFKDLSIQSPTIHIRHFSAATATGMDDDCISCAPECACNEETECWKCSHTNKKCSFFCSNDGCNAIQKVNTSDDCSYFELFNM